MSIKQYLQHYAETETKLADQLASFHQEASLANYQQVLTIPAFNEPMLFVQRVAKFNTNQATLVIVIINAPDKLASLTALQNTQRLAISIKQRYVALKQLANNAHLLELNHALQHHLLLVERCHQNNLIPYQQGVGLARKIACDIACRLIDLKIINQPWVHSTDADVSLPDNYFSALQHLENSNTAAAIYPFKHKDNANPTLKLAQNLYDFSLYYYVEGLHWANSPYAFHTIGSTLLIHHKHYAQCRGFPKKAAGEDFYLLNKMAKTGSIISLKAPQINIDSRESDRVPFGTGPALSKINQYESPRQEYLFYHPDCFYYLQQWILLIPTLWSLNINDKNTHSRSSVQALLANSINQLNLKNLNIKLLNECLIEINVEKALLHALQQSNSKAAFIKHMQHWFDAFKTLKFIHFLRKHGLKSIPIQTLSQQASFISETLKQRLTQLLQPED